MANMIFCFVLIGCSQSSNTVNKVDDQALLSGNQTDIAKDQIIKCDDLNSDGIEDKIILTLKDTERYKYSLQVNDIIIEAFGDNFEPKFSVVDINTSDKYKEIAVSEYGPSGDYATTFFYFDGNSIIPMGRIEGFFGIQYDYGNDVIGRMRINGTNKILTFTRGTILHTWFYQDDFRLSDKHLLMNEPKDLYEMNSEVKVIKGISLQKSGTDTTKSLTLKSGENVTIVASDNKAWCLVRNNKGETGWFDIENFNQIKSLGLSSSKVFDGLNNAD